MQKLRGQCPPVWMCCTGRSPSEAISNTAMLSCPRFDPYRNRPFGCTCRSAESFRSTKSSGNVVIVCVSVSLPCAASPVESRHRGTQLVDHESARAVGMEYEMPGPGARREIDRGLIYRMQPAVLAKPVHQNPVLSQVGHDCMAARRIGYDAMRVRPFLPRRIHAGSPLVLHEGNRLAHPAILTHRKHGETPTAVIGNEHKPPVRRKRHIARIRAVRGYRIDRMQPVVDAERMQPAAEYPLETRASR